MISNWRKDVGLTAVLILLTGVSYGFLLTPNAVPYSRHSDIVAQHLAMKDVAYRSMQEGRGLPLWKSDQLAGGPALTHPQALFTNPFQLLYLFVQPTRATGPTLWLHFLTMAVAFQVLGGVLKVGYGARALMAVAGLFAFKLIVIAYAGWLPVIPMFTSAPLLFAALFKLLDRPSLGSTLGLTAAGTLCLHSGHLQILYYALLFLGPYTLISLVMWQRAGRGAHARRVLLGGVSASLLASSMSAYLILPLAAEGPLTTRGEASYAFFVARPGFGLEHLATFLSPEALGTPLDDSYPDTELWEDVAYFGAIPELFASMGAILGFRRPHTRFLILTFTGAVVLAFESPITRLLFDYLPGFSLFRSPSRFLFLATLVGIPLAGIGLNELMSRLRQSTGWLPGIALFAVIAGCAAEGLYYVDRYLAMKPREAVLPETEFERFFAADPDTFRIAPWRRFTLNYGWAAPMGLELVTGFDAYNFRHYQDYFSLMSTGVVKRRPAPVWTDLVKLRRPDLLDALNVKYIASPSALFPALPNYELVAHFAPSPAFVFYKGLGIGSLYVYENESARKRAYWAGELVLARDAEHAIELLGSHDLRNHTVVEAGEAPTSAPSVQPDDALDILEAWGGHLALEARTAKERMLVLSEIWHPG